MGFHTYEHTRTLKILDEHSSAPKGKNSGREKEVKRSNNDNYGAVNRYGKQNENHIK